MTNVRWLVAVLMVISQQKCTVDEYLEPLDIRTIQSYIERFNQMDNELYAQYVPNDSTWDFLINNIPLIEIPDKEIEETYYFRWWTYRKHLKKTITGTKRRLS